MFTYDMSEDLKTILQASYKPQAEAQETLENKGYTYDKDLSTMEHKVFVNSEGTPQIAYRGTVRLSDWMRNSLTATGLEKYDTKFNEAKQLRDSVEAKYNKPPEIYGHSRGANLAEYAGKGTQSKVTTYNKPVSIFGLGKTLNENQKDIYTKNDIPSTLSRFQYGNKQYIASPLNPLKAHSTKNL
jgi:hypothetical protein